MKQDERASGRPFNAVLLILCAALPVGVATILLQIFGPRGEPLKGMPFDAFKSAAATSEFLPGATAYAAVTTVHLFVCTGAILFAWMLLRSVPNRATLRLTGLGLGTSVVALLLALPTLAPGLVAFELTYNNPRQLFGVAPDRDWLLQEELGLAPLAWAVVIPFAFGAYAVALAAAAAVGQLTLVDGEASRTEELREKQLCLATESIKRLAYALSLVLVTSTVGASLYFQLPSSLIGSALTDGDKTPLLASAFAQLERYGVELTMFWGATYSLTLFAAVGLPLLLVQHKVHDFLNELAPPLRARRVRERMTKMGALTGGGEQAKLLIAVVAPLVSAPIASFAQAVAS